MHAVAHATADEPLCSHHPDKRWVPVPPVGFLHVARCWLATHRLAAMGQDPHHWGRCRRPVRPNVRSTCPQGEPLIPRGSISVDAAERRNRFKVDARRGFLSDGRCPSMTRRGGADHEAIMKATGSVWPLPPRRPPGRALHRRSAAPPQRSALPRLPLHP
jgi:hypothetical protein